jgi:hypothetical protein
MEYSFKKTKKLLFEVNWVACLYACIETVRDLLELVPLYSLLESQDIMQVGQDWYEVLIKETLLVCFFSNFKSCSPGICNLHPDSELILLDMLDSLIYQHWKVWGRI